MVLSLPTSLSLSSGVGVWINRCIKYAEYLNSVKESVKLDKSRWLIQDKQ